MAMAETARSRSGLRSAAATGPARGAPRGRRSGRPGSHPSRGRARAPPRAGPLVPLNLIDATAGGIRLRCTLAEFARLSWAKETLFLQKNGRYSGYAPGQVFSWPYYGVGGRLGPLHLGNLPQTATRHSVPLGEVEISRGDHVHAADGDIGQVQGLVIDPRSHHVTHVLLQEGHLWGRKEVAIPISSVTSRRRHPAHDHQAAGAGPAASGH